MNRFLSICLICLLSQTAVAQLSQLERELTSYIDAHHEEAVQLLIDVVNINSGTQNFAGVQEVGQIFRDRFDTLGMTTQWIDGSSWNRAGHLVASTNPANNNGPHLLLIGHLDTVFQSDSPFQEYEYQGNYIGKGPGIADMKGGDVIILQALSALKDAGMLDDMKVTVYLTGDEESSGDQVLARAHMQEVARQADIALGFENGDGNPTTAIPARRGYASWELRVKGNPAHSSQIFQREVGAGAIFELSRILNSFYEELGGEQYLTFNPGVIIGGTELEFDSDEGRGNTFGLSNVVSQDAIARGDLRMISTEQTARARATMERIVAENLPLTSAELIFEEGMPPFPDSEGNRRLLGFFSQASMDLGYGAVTAVDPGRAGAADISYVGDYVDMAIDGMGMGGANDHTVNETGDLETLHMQAKRAAILMYRLVYTNLLN